MKPILQWLAYSIPTTFAYWLESMGFKRLAVATYTPITRAGYPPALFRLGWLLTDFTFEDVDVEKGKELIKAAAAQGHRRSQEWLNEYGEMTGENNDLFRELVNEANTGRTRFFRHIRSFLWLMFLAVIIIGIISK